MRIILLFSGGDIVEGETMMRVAKIVLLLVTSFLQSVAAQSPVPPLQFEEHMVPSSIDDFISVAVADFDGDDHLDLVALTMGTGQVVFFRGDGGTPPSFVQEQVLHDFAGWGEKVVAADFNGNGVIDFMATGDGTNSIVMGQKSFQEWHIQIVDSADLGPRDANVGDFDGNGLADLAITTTRPGVDNRFWYQYGQPGANPFLRRNISPGPTHEDFWLADFNGDGRSDILGFERGTIAFSIYLNGGAPDFGFVEQDGPPTTPLRSHNRCAADFDGDGDLDVVAHSIDRDKFLWYENNGNAPATWPERETDPMRMIDGVYEMATGDIDGDGDIDFVSSDNHGVLVFQNIGGTPPAFKSRVLSQSENGGWDLTLVDIDDDGDRDLFVADPNANTLYWYELISRIVEGSLDGEGETDGATDGEGDGAAEGEGVPEGMPDGEPVRYHTADRDEDGQISINELLRIIQLYNAGALHCASPSIPSLDGYELGTGFRTCPRHQADYADPAWQFSLSEVLRIVQFYNAGALATCDEDSEDGYCLGTPQ